jgi:hypothetical protein
MKTLWMMLFVCVAASASAQVIVQQSSPVVFQPSPDDAQTLNYNLEIRPSAGGAAVFTRALGKPTMSTTPCVYGTDADVMSVPCATVPIGWSSTQFAAIPAGTYVAAVSAVGSGGSSAFTVSLPFVVLAPAPVPFIPRPPVRTGVAR